MACRVTFYYDEIRVFSWSDRADLILFAEVCSAIEGRNLDGFERRESGLHQQFDLALIAESGDNASIAGGIRTGQQQSSGLGECVFQFHVAFEQHGPVSFWWLHARRALSIVEISFA